MKKIIFTVMLLGFVSLANSQWIQLQNSPPYSHALGNIGNTLFTGIQEETDTNIYISTNSGDNWAGIKSWIPSWVSVLTTSGSNLYAGANSNGVYLSTNNGYNWNYTGLYQKWVNDIAVSGNYIYVGTDNYGLYISSNSGINWIDPYFQDNIHSVSSSGSTAFAVQGFKIFRYLNNGSSYSNVLMNGSTFHCVKSEGNYVYAGSDSGIYRSSNNGDSWLRVPFTIYKEAVDKIAINGNNVFAGTEHGVYLSTNYGLNWIAKSQGLDSIVVISSMLINNNYIYLSLQFGKGVWRRSLSEIIDIKNIGNEIPSEYSLSQNYPNPFNPNTNIKFKIKESGLVLLKIFDINGREITTLVNEKLNTGIYEVDWNASQYPSGVYLYRLTVIDPLGQKGNFSETKKMIFIK